MSFDSHIDLASLTGRGTIAGVYSIVNPQEGTTKTNKPFLKCLLRDASGEVAGRQWDFDSAALDGLTSTAFVRVFGSSELYQDRVQIKITDIEPVDREELSDEDLRKLLPYATRDLDEMFAKVAALLGTLEHPAAAALAKAYLDDRALMEGFRKAPAAQGVHHAWIGGLLDHTLQLMEAADAMLPLYPELNRDLILLGLFLHDLGKVAELDWDMGFSYTMDGNLIGHIVRGAIWLHDKARAVQAAGTPIPPAALTVLQHIILSHHGLLEYGAAKVPSTPEAIFVAQMDNLDAKVRGALSATRPEGRPWPRTTRGFTDRVWFLDTRLYQPDPLADD
jgi:3'-5' exoribonuclease